MTINEARAAQQAQINNAVSGVEQVGSYPRAFGQGLQMRAQAGLLGSEMQEHVLKNQAAQVAANFEAKDDFGYTDPKTGILSVNPKYAVPYAAALARAGGNFNNGVMENANEGAKLVYGTSNKEITRPADGTQIIPGMNDERFNRPQQQSIVPQQAQPPPQAQTQQPPSIVPGQPQTQGAPPPTSPQSIASGATQSQGTQETPLQQPGQGPNRQSILPQPDLPTPGGRAPMLFSPQQGGMVQQGGGQASPQSSQSIVPQQQAGGPNSQQGSSIVPQQPMGQPPGIPGYNGPIIQGSNVEAIKGLNDTLGQLQGQEGTLKSLLANNDLAGKNNPHVMGWLGNMNLGGYATRSADAEDDRLRQMGDKSAIARKDREAARVGDVASGAKALTNRVTEKEIGLIAGGLPEQGDAPIAWEQHYARSLALVQANEALIRSQLANGGIPIQDQQRSQILQMARRNNGLDDNNNLIKLVQQGGGKPSIVPQRGELSPVNATGASQAIPGSIVPQLSQQGGQGRGGQQNQQALIAQAQDAINRGASKAAVMQRLQSMGVQMQ